MRLGYLLVILAAVFSFAGMARSPFNHPDEFNYIAGARTMVESGDWITPRYNFAPRVVKPALFYWIVAGGFEIFGPSVYVARLCAAAGAIAGVALVGLMAGHVLGRRYAAMAALIAASQLTIVQFSRFAITDTTLWAFCCLAHYAFFRLQFSPADRAEEFPPEPRRSWRWAMLFAVGLGLAVLTKGPIALLWCGIPVVWLLIRRDWTGLRRMHLVAGTALALLIVAPWAVAFVLRNREVVRDLLWNPSSPESYAQFSRPISSPLEFLAIVPLALMSVLPWIPAILAAFFANRGSMPEKSRERPLLVFWALAIILLLGLAHRKDFRYLVPLAAPAALLLARPMHRLFFDPKNRTAVSLLAILFELLFLALGIVILNVIVATRGLPVEHLLPIVYVLAGVALVLVGVIAFAKMQSSLPAILVAAMFAILGVMDWQFAPLAEPQPKTLALAVEHSLTPGQYLLCYEEPARELMYLARRPQREVKDFPRFLSELDAAPAVLVPEREWLTVPPGMRGKFITVGACVVQHPPERWSFDLADYRLRVLLLVRKPSDDDAR